MGPEHVGIAANLTTLAQIEMARGQYRDAEDSFKRSLVLTEKNLGPENLTLALVLMPYASLLRKTGRTTEADALEARAERSWQRSLGRTQFRPFELRQRRESAAGPTIDHRGHSVHSVLSS